jgi:hypothetical protein
MSKAPDLSAFPIPRKGGARPIVGDDTEGGADREGEGSSPGSPTLPSFEAATPAHEPEVAPQRAAPAKGGSGGSRSTPPSPASRVPSPPPQTYGQVVATTVKLDENRYLRLMEAGKPGPGRLKRRTIQEMLIEALDEWFERRQL